MKIISIAGGSGAGKSTVSYRFIDSDPVRFEILNFDDYHVFEDDNLLRVDGMVNWDHPDVIRWDDLLRDLNKLKRGEPVTVQSWAHRSVVDYHKHGQRKTRTIEPKDVLIVEGYLCLHDDEVNKLYDAKIFLNVDDETRLARRDKGDLTGKNEYDEKILMPMHKQFVEPTKLKADHVLDVGHLSPDEVHQQIAEIISQA